ncbi:patatin-like phospholipase family protein [Methylonatrum kenyense]|uniref:patatin-like phospholipase family protein n=1 Tax=Methylonatrum kenyense TaxID=455253 RepID=UPI0020C03033|nr:patatin-like phospholipase family protein [Methylonatrum kenyense]MCK8516185.1 patatin-like phospholipase family protein [Methylonatrum kenyense]
MQRSLLRPLLRILRSRPRKLSLALQGGGSHGAFTWGVLDRLLEEDILVDGVSGASAGALNAAALVDGWSRNGREGAREALERLWQTISRTLQGTPARSTPLDYLLSGWNRDLSPGFLFLNRLTHLASPYALNPSGYNPITDIAEDVFDMERLNRSDGIRLFVSMTDVRSGELALRRNGAINADVLAASACLPLLFQAVEIDGRPYWDGGYTGNPALYPLLFECRARDIYLVQFTPADCQQAPRRVNDIVARAREIAFHANLSRERAFVEMLQQQGPGWFGLRRWRPRLHRIESGESMQGLGSSSRLNTEWAFLCHLRDLGRQHMDNWLQGQAGEGP